MHDIKNHSDAMSPMGHSGKQASMNEMSHASNLKRKFFISLVTAIPIIILSPMMGMAFPFQLSFPGSEWVVLVLSTFLYFYGGSPFLRGAKQELQNKSPGMMTLITLGITTAYFYSLYAFVVNSFFLSTAHVMDFFWELATLIVIMLLGHWVEMRAVTGAGDALSKMAELLPARAMVRKEDGAYESVLLQELLVGQIVLVKAGEKIPADGIILEGTTSVNESMVTGESQEVRKKVGDEVIGGSQNGMGSIVAKVTGTGESGYLAQVMQLVGSAQQEKSQAETLSDKIARLLFFVAVGVGVVALVMWYIVTLDFALALTRMVTVLVIACPHALGLAIPLVTARSTSLGAENGLLVRNRQALEIAPRIDVVMMDKTGTLTEGNFKVVEVVSFGNAESKLSEEHILSTMAALESGSAHPLAAGIVNEASSRKLELPQASKVTVLPGVGLEGEALGKQAMIVAAAYLDKNAIHYDKKTYKSLSRKGYSVSFLLLDGMPVGLVAQGDEVKPAARHMVEQLKEKGITPMMLTGDNPEAASKIAEMLEITKYCAGLLPENKEKIVKKYHDAHKVVMMIGDGVNDAPSLARADVGVAIGAGTDIAIDSADVVLVKSNPADILLFLSLAKNTTRKMIQNLWWGAGYNIIAIPLAAGVLAPIGIILSPAIGAILMSLSTIIVAVNALTLRIRDDSPQEQNKNFLS